MVVVALLLRAEQRAHGGDVPTLRSLGLTRSDLGLVALLRSVPVAAGGALLAVVVAFVLSARYPIGIGHELELHRGMQANAVVLAATATVAFVGIIGCAFGLGRRASGRVPRRSSSPTIARRLARLGAPIDAVVGTQFAFEREGTRGSMSSRQAVGGGALALAVISAVGIFIAGTTALYDTPAAHGWPWEVAVGNQNFTFTGSQRATLQRLLTDRRIVARTRASFGQATIGGRSLEVLAIDFTGSAPPAILSGRLPRSRTEIAIGAKLGRELNAQVGSRVRLSIAGGDFQRDAPVRDVQLEVVGIAVPPVLGESELGESGIVTVGAIKAIGGYVPWRFVLARVAGTDPTRTVTSLSKSYSQEMTTDTVPARVVNLHRVRLLPVLAALLAAALGIILLFSTLAVSVRVRTRQLAVLRALGMPARRLRRVLAYQGVVLAIVICLIGLPIGVAVGSVLWRTIAHQLGVDDQVSGAFWATLLVPITILVGLAASIVPGRRAHRQDVASLLHAE
jgi:hypothetical protein